LDAGNCPACVTISDWLFNVTQIGESRSTGVKEWVRSTSSSLTAAAAAVTTHRFASLSTAAYENQQQQSLTQKSWII
jgi:hypothetical protein